MKILFIITDLAVGGAEMMLLKLLERIDRRQFDPHVISLIADGHIRPKIEALGIPVTSVGMHAESYDLRPVFRLVKLIKECNPDVVQTWMYHADLLGGIAARLAGVKKVVWAIRHSNLSKDVNKSRTLLVARTCARVSGFVPYRILCCSVMARKVHADLGYADERFVVIPNGFDLKRFGPDPSARGSIRSELGLQADTPLVGLVGRYDPQKNHLGFVQAAALVHRARPDVHFVLAGTNVDASNQKLVSAIQQAGLGSVMHLLGRRDDVPTLMASFDVLASSSAGEAFPNVLGEAMASSVPCVVTDVGDSADIVGPTGRVVTAGDMPALADRLLEVLSLPPDQYRVLADGARARVAERYEIGHVIALYQDFYRSLDEGIS